MKELSVEQKAKAYDNVVGKLKKFMAQGVDPLITRADVQDFFPELKESEDEMIRKALIRFHKSTIDVDGIKGEDIIAWLEKQGEQRPTDKVEPKFHEGDWIINPQGTLRHIINVDEGGYQTDGGWLSHETYEKAFHLWTIQDAKDGDVVTCPVYGSFSSKKIIFILKRLVDGDVECYCCINAYGNFDSCINTSDIIGEIDETLDKTPAISSDGTMKAVIYQVKYQKLASINITE